MDRGAWRAAVLGLQRVEHALATKTTTTKYVYIYIYPCISVYLCEHIHADKGLEGWF